MRLPSCSVDGVANALEDECGVVQDDVILEAQDGEPGRREPLVAGAITERWWKVSGAIGFDDEPLLFAEEVHDEGSQRLLPAKLRALELAAAQPSP